METVMPVMDAPLTPLMKKLRYYNDLSEADIQAVLALPFETKELARHSYIVREGDKTTHSCLLIQGLAFRQKIVGEGARSILAIHMPGDMVDLQNSFLGVADHSVQALTDIEVAFIPREAIKKVAFDYPAVGMAMWFDTLVDASIFREWIANVSRRDGYSRVAHLLCEFALRVKVAGLGDETRYVLPMSQEQLADCTGLTPVHVNRMLKRLGDEGLIERRTHRDIRIGDWKKLAEAGDFDSTYLHLQSGEPALS